MSSSWLFFDLILCSVILISFRPCDASTFIMFYLFHCLQPLSSVLCPLSTFLSFILHPLSTFHPPPLHHSVTLVPILHLPSPSSLLSISLSPNSLPLHSILFLSSQHLFITPCLPVPTLSTLHSVPCDYVSHFLHSPYYPVCCTSPSLVVYKSFQLVVYSLACNCHPLLPTQSPLSLPPVSYQSLPWQYNPLVSPLLVSSKIKDTPVPWQGCNT